MGAPSAIPEAPAGGFLRWLRVAPADGWAVLLLVAIAAAFFVAVWKLTPGRSFHADELTNLIMHMLREGGVAAEEQHRYFHDFYAWWLQYDFDERYARIPSLATSILSLFALAALAWRIAGRGAAVIAALLFVLWPRTWDDAQEMRYYSFLFLCGTLGFHLLLSTLRGAWWTLPVLAGMLGIVVGWHATATPFHAGALGLAAAIVLCNAAREAKRWRTDGGSFPAWKVGVPAGLLAAGLIAALAVGPAFVSRNVTGIMNLGDAFSRMRFEPWYLLQWVVNWGGDRFHPYPAAALLLWPGFLGLAAIGGAVLWRRAPMLLLCGVALFLAQAAAALLFRHTWQFVAFTPKYLTSSGVGLFLLIALGIDAALRWSRHQQDWRRGLAPVAIFALFVLPLLPRTYFSATGDAAAYADLWKSVLRRADGQTAFVAANGEFKQSSKVYRYLIDGFKIHEATSESFLLPNATYPISAAVARRNPVFFIIHPKHVEPATEKGFLRVLESRRSTHSTNWDFVLLGKGADRHVATGTRIDLTNGERIQFLEAGTWKLAGPSATTLGERKLSPGELLAPAQFETIEVADAPAGAALVPVLVDGEFTRAAGFADDGPLHGENAPRGSEETPIYQLANVFEVDYDLFIPDDARSLEVHAQRDLPELASYLVRLDGQPVGLFLDDPKRSSEPEWVGILPLAPEKRGRVVRVTISYHGENSVRKPDSDKVRVLRLQRLVVSAKEPEKRAAKDNLFRAVRFVPPPKWAPQGIIDFSKPGGADLLSFPEEKEPIPEVTQLAHAVMIGLEPKTESQLVIFPPIAVRPGEVLGLEILGRTRNMLAKDAAPVIHLYKGDGAIIRSGQLSQLYYDSLDPDWTNRTFLESIPPEAAFAVVGFYINSPRTHHRLRDDARLEFKHLRFLKR